MAIDRLSSTASLIAALRSDATRKGVGSQELQNPAAKPSTRAPGRPTITHLRRELVEMVKHVALDDPKAVREVRPRMIKAILLWEFGASLREHPEWRPMLDNIVQTLEADPAQHEKFVALLAELKTQN